MRAKEVVRSGGLSAPAGKWMPRGQKAATVGSGTDVPLSSLKLHPPPLPPKTASTRPDHRAVLKNPNFFC